LTKDILPDFQKMADEVRRYLSALRSELQNQEREVADTKLKIAQQELILSTFAPMVEDIRLELEDHLFVEGVADEKLANACRMVLQAAPIYRSPRGIRDTLEQSGYHATRHKNMLASVHAVLKRLVESGEVEEMEINGGTRYRWKQPTARSGYAGYSSYGPKNHTNAFRELAESVKPQTAAQTFIDEISKKK